MPFEDTRLKAIFREKNQTVVDRILTASTSVSYDASPLT